MGVPKVRPTLVGVAVCVPVLLSLAGGMAGSGTAAPRAKLASPVDLSGYWANKADETSPAWRLTASNSLKTLEATWTGGAGHNNLHGEFHGQLTREGEYQGPFHISEEEVKVDGTMFVIVRSSVEIQITLRPNSGGQQEYAFIRRGSPVTPEETAVIELLSTPPSFGKTVTAPAPPPGGVALTSSPELANAKAVEANVQGLSENDLVFVATVAAAVKNKIEQICFLAATKATLSFFKLSKKPGPVLESEYDQLSEKFAQSVFLRAAACVASAEQALAAKAGAAGAGTSSVTNCSPRSIALVSRRSHGKTRLLGAHVGGSPLSVSCSLTAGAMKLRISSRSGSPLRKSLGSRVMIGVGRSHLDPAGGQLGVSFRKG